MTAPAVVDASVAVKWFLPSDPLHSAAVAVRDAQECMAPTLLLAEVANALWKYLRLGRLDLEDVLDGVGLCEAEYHLTDDRELISAAQRLSAARDHPVNDCLYASLAVRSGAPMITADAKLERKLSGVSGLHLVLLSDAVAEGAT